MKQIYVIQGVAGGPFKIGSTAWDVEKRIIALQVGNPWKLALRYTIPGGSALESKAPGTGGGASLVR